MSSANKVVSRPKQSYSLRPQTPIQSTKVYSKDERHALGKFALSIPVKSLKYFKNYLFLIIFNWLYIKHIWNHCKEEHLHYFIPRQ